MHVDTFYLVFGGFAAALLGIAILAYIFDRPSIEKQMTEAYGELNSLMVCPHCQSKGAVRKKSITQKGGISGTKATAALFTAGVSLFATGLAKKSTVTQAYCGSCQNVWSF